MLAMDRIHSKYALTPKQTRSRPDHQHLELRMPKEVSAQTTTPLTTPDQIELTLTTDFSLTSCIERQLTLEMIKKARKIY